MCQYAGLCSFGELHSQFLTYGKGGRQYLVKAILHRKQGTSLVMSASPSNYLHQLPLTHICQLTYRNRLVWQKIKSQIFIIPWLTYSLPLEGLCCCNAIKLQKCVVGFVILYFLQLSLSSLQGHSVLYLNSVCVLQACQTICQIFKFRWEIEEKDSNISPQRILKNYNLLSHFTTLRQ